MLIISYKIWPRLDVTVKLGREKFALVRRRRVEYVTHANDNKEENEMEGGTRR